MTRKDKSMDSSKLSDCEKELEKLIVSERHLNTQIDQSKTQIQKLHKEINDQREKTIFLENNFKKKFKENDSIFFVQSDEMKIFTQESLNVKENTQKIIEKKQELQKSIENMRENYDNLTNV